MPTIVFSIAPERTQVHASGGAKCEDAKMENSESEGCLSAGRKEGPGGKVHAQARGQIKLLDFGLIF